LTTPATYSILLLVEGEVNMNNQRPVIKETDFLCKNDPEGFNRPPSQDGKCSQALGVLFIVCKNCGMKFRIWRYEKNRAKFCSRKCRTEWQKGRSICPKTQFKKGCVPPYKGKSLIHSGSFKSGKDHWNWKGGKDPMIVKLRASKEYKLWRKAVFTRDNYTCIVSEGQEGFKAL
jgi:hypothetical protein